MFGLSIACLVVGAAGGVYLAARFLPPLASTQEGVIATWIVRVFFAGAVAWIAVQLYFMIHAYANLHREGAGFPLPGDDKSQILTSTLQTILLYGGLLVGAASIIYLLAPTDDTSAAAAPSAGEHVPAAGTQAPI